MTVTVADLIDRAQRRADFVNDPFITTEEWTEFFNASAGELYDLLTMRFQHWFTTDTTFSVTGSAYNTSRWQPATMPLQILSIEKDIGGTFHRLKEYQLGEKNSHTTATSAYAYLPVMPVYQVFADYVDFLPIGQAQGDYRLFYVPGWTDLTGSQAIPAQMTNNHWDEYIVIDMAIKALEKDRDDSSALRMDKEAIKMRITNAASRRNVTGGKRIQDTVSDPFTGRRHW